MMTAMAITAVTTALGMTAMAINTGIGTIITMTTAAIASGFAMRMAMTAIGNTGGTNLSRDGKDGALLATKARLRLQHIPRDNTGKELIGRSGHRTGRGFV